MKKELLELVEQAIQTAMAQEYGTVRILVVEGRVAEIELSTKVNRKLIAQANEK